MKKLLLLLLTLCCAVRSAWPAGPAIIDRLEFHDAPVLDMIQLIARRGQLDLVIGGDAAAAQGRRSSLTLNQVTAEEALEEVLKANGLTYERQDKRWLISLSPQVPGGQAFSGRVAAWQLRYLAAEKMVQLLGRLWPELKASRGGSENSLIVQGREAQLAQVALLIKELDRPVPQVLIESQVVEVTEDDSLRLGLNYGEQTGYFKFPAGEVPATLNALLSKGVARLVATPRIATLDGHEAVINIGSRIPYAVPVSNGSGNQWAVEYIDAGVKLKITPFLGASGEVTTSLQPEISSIAQWRTTAAGEFPVISTRNAAATLRVKDGETIVVGGLMSESERENVSRIPIIGQIPILNLLFQNRTVEMIRTEIIFLITPHVI